jgi:dethiobiotin synthetase
MKSLFITGTDTGVGKTFVTAGILSHLRRRGVNCIPAKPFQTGCVNGNCPDLEFALETAGISVSEEQKSLLCPWRFEPACSPHLAAELFGVRLDPLEAARNLRSLDTRYETVIAEGAGGILVPLGKGLTMLDLMAELGWPVVLVSANRLGTINHTLLSIRCLEAAGIRPAGVIFTLPEPGDPLIERDNIITVEKHGAVRILGLIPHSPEVFPYECFEEVCGSIEEVLSL